VRQTFCGYRRAAVIVVDSLAQEAVVNASVSPVPGCSIELRPERERVLILLDGELDLATVESVRHELETLRSVGWRQVVLDLGAVGFMDLAGVRLLLGAFEQADQAGSLFMIRAASPQVHRILELTGNVHVLAGCAIGVDEDVRVHPPEMAGMRAVEDAGADGDQSWDERR
jgi:anti-sigma B factor antagonist